MSRKVFTAGEVLAAADVNNFLMNQTVMSFAGTASRTASIPTPLEGMYTHLEDTDRLEFWNGSTWVQPTLPTGGTALQILQKTSGTDYAASWVTRAASTAAISTTVIATSYTNYITIVLTCSGRPVSVSWNAWWNNAASGANRTVGFRAALDGTIIGTNPAQIFAPLTGSFEQNSESILVTPAAGSRTFTFQAQCSTASACVIQAATLNVFEV